MDTFVKGEGIESKFLCSKGGINLTIAYISIYIMIYQQKY